MSEQQAKRIPHNKGQRGTRYKGPVDLSGPPDEPRREPPAWTLTWHDIIDVHVTLQSGLYTCGKDIWKAEADHLNKLIASRMPKN